MKNAIVISIVTFLILNLLFSCTVQKRFDKKCQKAKRKYELQAFKYGCDLPFLESVKDSIVITKHDTTVIIKTEYFYQFDTIRLDSTLTTEKSILNTKYAISTAWVQFGQLQHILEQQQVNTPITIKDALQSTTATKETIIKVPYPVEKLIEKDLSWMHKTLLYSGGVFWLILIAWTVIKLRKLFIP